MKGILRHVVLGLSGCLLTASVAAIPAAEPNETWQIRGRVVDEQGQPVEQFVAAMFWSANGKPWSPPEGAKDKQPKPEELNKEEGVMAPYPAYIATQLENGRFEITSDRPRVSIFATDPDRRVGGYVSVEKENSERPVTITLRRLVRVQGKIYCPQAERTPDGTMVVVHPPGDQENRLHFTHCGSLKGEFSFLLPPGPYDFDVYSSSPDAHIRKSTNPPTAFGIRVDVPADQATLDLGTLNVEIPAGRGDYSRYYGKEPPELEITDARGVPKEVKLADFRGKWVLVDFWFFGCSPCVHGSLPELMKLYEEHAAAHDRFEILAVCVNQGDGTQTVADYEPREAELAENIWNGKRLPFPVLIDGQKKTCDKYNIGSFPTTLLIDPEGHLVKWGDAAMLVEKLKEK